MAKAAQIAVGEATPVLLADGEGPQQQHFRFKVLTGGPVFIGGDVVTSATGGPLAVAEGWQDFEVNGDQLFAICAAATTATVAVIQTISGVE